jgi:hypothetical protein
MGSPMSAFDTLTGLLTVPTGSPEHILKVLDEVSGMESVAAGAYWATVHCELGLRYGALFPLIESDPRFEAFVSLLPDETDAFHRWMLEQTA